MPIFQISPLLIKACASAALFVSLVVFEVVTRISDHAKIRSGQAEDMRKNNTLMKRYNAVQLPRWRWWSEALLIIATGVMMLATMVSVNKYQAYGAFYDGSWRMPDVEEHMLFRSDGTEALQAIYDADPAGFDFDAYKVCLVRLGCEDCANVKETILALDDSFYVVFSRSDIGKRYAERYDVDYVPSVVYHGAVLEMRTNGNTDGEMPDAPDTEDVPGMIDDLTGLSGDHELQPGNPGTAAGIGIVDDEAKAGGDTKAD